jgi:hypothetical protein
MLAITSKRLDMGSRVLEFARQHPDTSPAFTAAVARLQERLARAKQLDVQQHDGRTTVHLATARKAELRRLIRRTHLHHLRSVAEVASVDEPDLVEKFSFPRHPRTYRGFLTAASGMAAEARSRKELLLKHGLAEEVLTGLEVALEQFEVAAEQGAAGRLAHVTAKAELDHVAEEVDQIVDVMSGLVRVRFATQPQVLAAWESASNVVAAPRPEEKPESGTAPAGDVRPAA